MHIDKVITLDHESVMSSETISNIFNEHDIIIK